MPVADGPPAGTAPLDDPLSYPGPRASAAFHLRGSTVHPLVGDPPTDRHPVLAIGSNACPGQLAVKFRGRPCRDDVVGVVVRVAGLQIRPSAHLGRAGYWPFAPAALDASASTTVLCLLDDDQLAVLDATEPNYDRIPLPAPAEVVTGAPPAILRRPVELYASRHGVVDDPRLPSWSDPPPTQEALLSAVLPLLAHRPDALPPGVRDAGSLSSALRRRPGLADRLTDVLKHTVRTRPDGLR